MLHFHVREIIPSDDSLHAGYLFCFGGIDGFDYCVGVGASQHLADKLARKIVVGRITGPSSDLVDGVRPVGRIGPAADHFVNFFFVGDFSGKW